MNKKGFTLVEMIGVITLLALISLVSIPPIITQVNKKRNEMKLALIENMKAASSLYVDNNKKEFLNQVASCIKISTLVDKEYLDDNIYDYDGFKMDLKESYILFNRLSSELDVITECPSSYTRPLKDAILKENYVVRTPATLTTTSEEANENGLYVSTATNSGDETYFFRGNVENNYVYFAGYTWRIVRVNEDGTIRLIMQEGINNNKGYKFNANANSTSDIYYSNGLTSGTAKYELESWYDSELSSYENYLTVGFYCEQNKAKDSVTGTTDDSSTLYYKDYISNFTCSSAKTITAKVGLLTYDELVSAGWMYNMYLKNNYLNNLKIETWWTMSGNEMYNGIPCGWDVWSDGGVGGHRVTNKYSLRPVINLKSTVNAIGSGTAKDPYRIVTVE